MSGERGAAWCQTRGIHSWRKVVAGVELCTSCRATRRVEITSEELARRPRRAQRTAGGYPVLEPVDRPVDDPGDRP